MNKKQTFEYCLDILKSYTTEEEFVILKKKFYEVYFVDNLFRYKELTNFELEDFVYYPQNIINDNFPWSQTKNPNYWAEMYNKIYNRHIKTISHG
jgi:hypothetical protein